AGAGHQQRELVTLMHDEFTRRMLAEVFAADDESRRDFERWEAQREKEKQQQRKSLGPGIVIQRLVDRPVHTPVMAELDHGAWNEWAKTIAREEAIDEATTVNNKLVDELDKFSDELHARFDRRKAYFEKRDDDLSARIDELEQRIETIEQRLDDLEGSGEQQKVVPMLTFRGGREAA